ncbi:restriction endonuclease subunit S [Chroococcus sp. FPU101]|uniref:restriction endonuclease subunit S n=1 Tax=Chroococcus sp. FPU101 TaxID=1974212 RepID=UPI001A905CFB|nr:restriction endonuclease subunit S [Chroococcus sp. FPU101]GFE71900.1 restriction modification system DNA specificity domain protein [Chroococcus sp. FPU101]
MTLAIENPEIRFFGKVPEHWEIVRIRRITKEHKQGYYTEQAYIDEGVKLVRITDIDDSANVSFENMPFVTISSKDERAFKVEKGDFLFARSGTIGRFGLVREPERSVFASYLIRFRFKDVNLEFLRFVFSSQFFKEGLISTLHGGANKNVHAENIKEQFIAIPPPDMQSEIASFLDRKTAALATLITKKQRLIQLLEEKRTVLINQAVTKGLNSNILMRDSGISWIGKVPEHWEIVRIRRITKEHKQGYYTEQAYIDEGVKLVRITDIDDSANVSFENMPFVTISSKDERAFKVEKGDFLFARSGTIGRFGLVREPERSVFASYLIRFRFKDVNLEFLRFVFSSQFFKEGLISTLHGGANKNVHAENIKEQFIAIPPSNVQGAIEQVEIANFLDSESAAINQVIDRIKEQIEKLQEYRQTLITAAVTGKIDVREEVAV